MGVKKKRCKLWWAETDFRTCAVETLVKEELCDEVVEVRRRNDTIMAMVMKFEKEISRMILLKGHKNFVTSRSWQ